MTRGQLTIEQERLLEVLQDGLWHFKTDLTADPRLCYRRLPDDTYRYEYLKKDLTRIKKVARLEFRSAPSGAYRLLRRDAELVAARTAASDHTPALQQKNSGCVRRITPQAAD